MLFIYNKGIIFSASNIIVKHFSKKSYPHCSILRDCFGMSRRESELYADKHKLFDRNSENMIDCIQFCRSVGFADEDILESPTLLCNKAMILEQHYLTLQEGGFHSITPQILSSYRKYFSMMISKLKNELLIDPNTNVAESFINYFKPLPSTNMFPTFSDNERWRDVHITLLKTYLKWRLNASETEIEVLFRTHKMVQNKSVRLLCENITLAEELEFPVKKLLKYGYLLHTYPKYTKQVLRDFPNLAGADIRRCMRLYPKLMMVSPKNILKIYGILKEFGISDAAIRKQMNVFTMSPETVLVRLQELTKMPEFKVLMTNVGVLRLVVYHNRAKCRLSYLQSLQLQCASLLILGDCGDKFDIHIKQGVDKNQMKEVTVFFNALLQADPSTYMTNLTRHPYYLQVPMTRIENTYCFLKENNFHNSDICKVIQILLYPRGKIEPLLESIEDRSPSKKIVMTRVQQLNLILYLIEKEHHFTGNGIWTHNTEIIPPVIINE